jgi:hypothetical protein
MRSNKNPLTVDLCKVALWIEGHSPGLPLSFLDHASAAATVSPASSVSMC